MKVGDWITTVETGQVGKIVAVEENPETGAPLKVMFADFLSQCIAGQSLEESLCKNDIGWYAEADVVPYPLALLPVQPVVHRHEDPDPEAWGRFITAMHSGDRFECDEEMWMYWLEVLPPVWMHFKDVTFKDGQTVKSSFGFCEGYDYVTAFWREGGRYFGRRTDIMNPRGY